MSKLNYHFKQQGLTPQEIEQTIYGATKKL